MISIQCALCGRNQKTIELFKENFLGKNINASTFSARRPPDKLHYKIVKCINCGLIFSNPIFPIDKIKNLYRKSKFNYFGESKYLRKTYGGYLKKILPSKNIETMSLLEIGCGNGFFLEEAIEIGIKNVFGVEPSVDSIKKSPFFIRNKIKNDILRPNLFEKNSFDIICFFHTLDHVIDPNDFLTIVYNLLKKNGKVICVVHNTDGLLMRLLGEKSPIFDIEHIYLFNKTNIVKIFKKNSLKPLKVMSVKNRYPIKYWLKLTPIAKTLKTILNKFLSVIGIGNLPIEIYAGNMVIIAEKID